MMELRTMVRMNKTKRVTAITGLLAGLALGSATTFAQTNAPAATVNKGGAMMDHQMPERQGRMMPGMMMSGEMQQQMTRMMDNCNRMMQSMMPNKDGTPSKNG